MKTNYRQAVLSAIDESGFSDYEIARMTKIRPSSISRWRTGRTTPRKNSLRLLAGVLGTSVRFYTDGMTQFAEFQEIPPGERPGSARYEDHAPAANPIPVFTWTQIQSENFFSGNGIPKGDPVHQLPPIAELNDPTAYAVIRDVQREIPMDPFLRYGDVIIISPTATIRNGDHVLARLNDGTLLARRIQLREDDILFSDTGSETGERHKALAVSFQHKISYIRKR